MKAIQILKEKSFQIALALLVALVFGYEWYQAKKEGVIQSAAALERPHAPAGVLAEGRLVPYPGAEVTLGAELSGRLTSLAVSERDPVKQGDVLAEIDVSEQRAALSEAWARVREAQADIEYLGREHARTDQLYSENVIARAAFDKSEHEAKSAKHRRSSLVASAERLGVVVKKAQIAAPIDGTVTQRFVDPGEMVGAGAPLVTVTDLSQLRVEAEVGEFDAARVKLGAAVAITAEGHGGRVFRGTVEEIPDVVVARQLKPLDPSRPVDTRVLLVKVKLAEAVPLKLGQRVEVEISE